MDKLPIFVAPYDPETKIAFLEQYVTDLWYAVQDLQESLIVPQKAAPAKPREGMIRYADGVSWDPGSGAGLYQYIGASWNKL